MTGMSTPPSDIIRWCDENDVENLNDLTGRQLQAYALWRRRDGDLTQASLKRQMDTIRVFIRFCERVDGVRPNLHDKVLSVNLTPEEKRRETLLEASDAKELLDYLSKFRYASFEHTLLAVLWNTGMRTGAAYGLDLSDYRPRKELFELYHRPDQETPLKNRRDGERHVALSPDVCSVVDDWIEHHRPDVTDDYGREPPFATEYGRAHKSTIRDAV